VAARTSNSAQLTSRLASAFSNRMGFTLCGIVLEPTVPWPLTCAKYPREMYVHTSVHRLCTMRLNRAISA
jgi:hypothetical protein